MMVIKVGGNELDDPTFVQAFAKQVAAIQPVPILIHGGGKEVGLIQQALGEEPTFVDGLRVTSETALAAAQMVLCGAVSTRLVAALLAEGADALGMSGVDRGLVRVERQYHPAGDLGRVGRPVAVRGDVLRGMLSEGVLPVIAPISLGPDGPYNVNADEVAGSVAAASGAVEVVFVTNVVGVLVDGQIAHQLDETDIMNLIGNGTISGGMIPKVRSALTALAAGVPVARITNLAGLAAGGTRIMRV